MSETERRFPEDPEIRFTIDCDDLEYALEGFVERQGYRLFSIFPADAPRRAIVEREGAFVALESTGGAKSPDEGAWHEGRAGMEYRDLLPGRGSGNVIASHIRIEKGGPVPDYVHFHKVAFQVIYCLQGSCRLVYESQGEPFEFSEGDCVLQPPGIRHRVLECSEGFEVLEISSPAEHATYAEHGFDLPSPETDSQREFSGQRFHRHISLGPAGGVEDLGLEDPSNGSVRGELIRQAGSDARSIDPEESDVLVFVRKGNAKLIGAGGSRTELAQESACLVQAGSGLRIEFANTEILVFRLQSESTG